jgi:hypothetical protein
MQVLQKMHKEGQLLQPLQSNNDVRIIRAGPTGTNASAVLQHSSQELDLQPQPVLQHPQPVAHGSNSLVSDANRAPAAAGHPVLSREELYAHVGALRADSCLAALQSGFTVVVRDMPKRSAAVGLLTEVLETQTGLHAGANLYITPAGE